MTIFQSSEVVANKPASQSHVVGTLSCMCHSITIAANPIAADTYEFGLLPAGATVVGGWIYAPDLDTNATETLDMDIGWQANVDEIADPDGFGNLGVLVGDVAAGNSSRIVSLMIPLGGVLQSAGPKTFTAETMIEMVCNVTAATGGTGVVTVRVDYLSP